MSSIGLNSGTAASEPGSRVPYELLEPAIRWETVRERLCRESGRPEDAMCAGLLKRFYQQRVVNETA